MNICEKKQVVIMINDNNISVQVIRESRTNNRLRLRQSESEIIPNLDISILITNITKIIAYKKYF